jgi:hypothetical protein
VTLSDFTLPLKLEFVQTLGGHVPNESVRSAPGAYPGLLGCSSCVLNCAAISLQHVFGLSLSLRWPRQGDQVENLADKKVSLNGGQVFSYDLIVEPQTK